MLLHAVAIGAHDIERAGRHRQPERDRDPLRGVGGARDQPHALGIAGHVLEQERRWLRPHMVYDLAQRSHFKLPVGALDAHDLACLLGAFDELAQIRVRRIVGVEVLRLAFFQHGRFLSLDERPFVPWPPGIVSPAGRAHEARVSLSRSPAGGSPWLCLACASPSRRLPSSSPVFRRAARLRTRSTRASGSTSSSTSHPAGRPTSRAGWSPSISLSISTGRLASSCRTRTAPAGLWAPAIWAHTAPPRGAWG